MSAGQNHRKGFRFITIVAWLIFTWALLEVGSMVAWYAIDGRWFAYNRVDELRVSAGSESGGFADEVKEEGVPVAVPARFEGQVIHPFLGYVYTPEFNALESRRSSPLVVGGWGFFHRRQAAAAPASDALRVGIFGGSVAFGFGFHGGEIIEDVLSKALEREVVIESRAHAGYKQPQQLMTLAWLMSLGEAPDVVVNLDGFNDIVLPVAENMPSGTYPFFPRAWEHRVQSVPDPKLLRLSGESSYLEGLRGDRARWGAGSLLRWSPTFNVLWLWRDRNLQRHQFELNRRVAELELDENEYVARGPDFPNKGEHEMMRSSAQYWQMCSRLMDALAKSEGVKYFHFLQPNQYVPGSKTFSRRELEVAIDSRNPYRAPAEQGYGTLRRLGAELAEEGVSFHDLTQAFSETRESVYVDSCCHFNELGNEIVARKVADVLVRELGGTRLAQ
ncbi:MAG: hypothetical protein AAF481_10795 [Acidobacteriota bacterium]